MSDKVIKILAIFGGFAFTSWQVFWKEGPVIFFAVPIIFTIFFVFTWNKNSSYGAGEMGGDGGGE